MRPASLKPVFCSTRRDAPFASMTHAYKEASLSSEKASRESSLTAAVVMTLVAPFTPKVALFWAAVLSFGVMVLGFIPVIVRLIVSVAFPHPNFPLFSG